MLVFQNEGLVPLEAFTTFGMSAKPGSSNPIGKFGTGLKYAVAITLRLGGTFKLYRGQEEYEFYTKDTDFRGKTFAKVRMRRRKGVLSAWRYEALPFTTELGKHWKPWMAFRELEANVRDEHGTTKICDNEWWLNHGLQGVRDGVTTITVDCPELDEAYADIDNIFLPQDRMAPIYEDENVRIFEGENNHVFYRGMRVTDTRKPTLYTYEMKHVFLTEDRTSQYTFLDNQNIMKGLLACDDRGIANNVVRNAKDHHEENFDWDRKSPTVGRGWSVALSHGGLSPRFESLRNNLDYGLGKSEDVEIMLTVAEWEDLLSMLPRDHETVANMKEQLTEAGWRETKHDPAVLDEIAEAADD